MVVGGPDRMPWDKDIDVEVEFGFFPRDETCSGADFSPQVKVRGLKAPYLALIMDDPDAEKGGFSHWLLWNVHDTDLIPRNIPKSAIVDYPIRALQGRNGYDEIGYSGPCPPENEEHEYVFRVYGLDEALDLNPSSTRKDLERAMDGHIVQYGQVEVKFQRVEPIAISGGDRFS